MGVHVSCFSEGGCTKEKMEEVSEGISLQEDRISEERIEILAVKECSQGRLFWKMKRNWEEMSLRVDPKDRRQGGRQERRIKLWQQISKTQI